jgi:hypothetical protein
MRAAATLVAVLALLATPAAVAKDFQPGDLRLCNARHCVPVTDETAVAALSRFYYLGSQPALVLRPRLGAPYLELRFRNGYVTGIVATRWLNRFLSYGVYLERFQRGSWYRMPPAAAQELRTLAEGLTPLRLTLAALDRSR